VNSGAVAVAHGLSLPTGLFVARFSSRTAAILGTILFASGFLASAYTTSLWQLYLTYSLMVGLGMSQLGGPAQASLLASWVPIKHLGLCLGISISGASIGAVVLPYLFDYLLHEFGLKTTFQIISGISFFTNIISALFLLPPEKAYNRPNLGIFNQKKLIPYLFGLPILLVGYWMIFVFLTPFAKNILGMQDTQAAYLLVIIGAANFIGRIGSGYLSDHFGALPVFCYTTFSKGILSACFPLLRDPTVLYVYTGFMGIFAGGVFGLLPKTLVEYFGVQSLPLFYGLVFSVSAIGSVGGPPLIGAIIDEYDYLVGGITACCFLWVGTGVLLTLNCYEKFKAKKPEISVLSPLLSNRDSMGSLKILK